VSVLSFLVGTASLSLFSIKPDIGTPTHTCKSQNTGTDTPRLAFEGTRLVQ